MVAGHRPVGEDSQGQLVWSTRLDRAGYKFAKSEGWQLQRTRITDCARLERLWLAMAVATMWVLEVGGAAEVEEQQGRPKAPPKGKKVGEDTPALPDLEEARPVA